MIAILYREESLHLPSLCEAYVAIIVASMPAFASFFNGTMPGVLCLASVNSFLHRRSSRRSTRDLESLSVRCAEQRPSSGQYRVPHGHALENGYHELHDTNHFPDSGSGSTKAADLNERLARESLEEDAIGKLATTD